MAQKKQTLESAMDALQQIVEKLEAGSLPLEESLKLYEEGVKLTAFCNKELKGAKLKISELKEPQGEMDETDE